MIPRSLRKLVFELSKLPAIGERSAYRIAYHILSRSRDESQSLIGAIESAIEDLGWCKYCGGLSDDEVCGICNDHARIRNQLCVVERPSDIFSLERSASFKGLYHVLHGVWSPLRGVKPEDLALESLYKRVSSDKDADDPLESPLSELILATSTTIEGDATALYIANELDQSGLNITRLAQGLPKGGELEYADELTLSLSFEGRKRV